MPGMRSRLSLVLTLAAFGSGALGWWGCSSGSNNDVSCGTGTVAVGKTCIAESIDGGTSLRDGGAGRDGGATGALGPTFAGATAAAPASPTSVLVSWNPATEADMPASSMRYRVYVASGKSAINYMKPAATTVSGASSFYLTSLSAGMPYSVAVRALDPAGNADSNVVVKTVTPGADTTPPTFAGVTGAAPAGPGAVALKWAAASDDHTPAGAVVYFVYVGNQLTSFDYSTPTLITDPGVTTVTVPNLYDPSLVYNFTVRARDAAGNFDANTATASSRAGTDMTAPQFAGCASAIADSAGSAVITWSVATDDSTPQSLLTYDIYDSNPDAGFSFAKPVKSVQGTGIAEVTGLSQATTWHFVVRARDFVGNEDQNLVDCVTKTSTDPTPPTFAGCTGVVVQSDARTATFSWSPATDPVTSPDKIVYDVFQGLAPGAEDYTKPIATSDPGATSVFVTDLTPDATLYWVVRARDQAGNRDSNAAEQTGVTDVSLSEQVQETFSSDCGVAGCHAPGNPPLGLVLTPQFAYANIVGVQSREYGVEFRVNPSDPTTSFLYRKVSENPPPVGYQMPAPATGSVLEASEIDRIRRWILQGAPDN
jgi:hypothetical protein